MAGLKEDYGRVKLGVTEGDVCIANKTDTVRRQQGWLLPQCQGLQHRLAGQGSGPHYPSQASMTDTEIVPRFN